MDTTSCQILCAPSVGTPALSWASKVENFAKTVFFAFFEHLRGSHAIRELQSERVG